MSVGQPLAVCCKSNRPRRFFPRVCWAMLVYAVDGSQCVDEDQSWLGAGQQTVQTRLRVIRPRGLGSTSERGIRFFSHSRVQVGSGHKPTSCSMGTGNCFPVGKLAAA